MDILINYKSKIPIYEQISSQIKLMILSDKLKEGDPLPAMRPLAKSLRVSVITVQKAYEGLQNEGYIDSVIGRGTFVSKTDKDQVKEKYLQEISSELQNLVRLIKKSGIEIDEVVALLRENYNRS